jgi:hypothetical protein
MALERFDESDNQDIAVLAGSRGQKIFKSDEEPRQAVLLPCHVGLDHCRCQRGGFGVLIRFGWVDVHPVEALSFPRLLKFGAGR